MTFKKIISAVAVAAAALAAPAANATFINGSVSFSGGFGAGGLSNLPNSLVSNLTSFVILPNGAVTGAGNGDLNSLTFLSPIGASSFSFGGLPTNIYTAGAFTFQALSIITTTPTSFACGQGPQLDQCSDALAFVANGVVTGGGYQATGMTLSWSAQGTCNESTTTAGTCGSNANASWSASISATGSEPPPRLPEPASLALVGVALAGLGLARRQSKKA